MTKETTYTPGPWVSDDSKTPIKIRCNQKSSVNEKEARIIATPFASFDIGYEEYKANARLIAAAPDLLSVCERLLEDAAKYKKLQYESGTFALLNAAIAKATSTT